jgi:hypothetical protein
MLSRRNLLISGIGTGLAGGAAKSATKIAIRHPQIGVPIVGVVCLSVLCNRGCKYFKGIGVQSPRAWGIDLAIPAASHEIALVVKDVGSRITDPHGHGDWLNAGFVTG